MIRRYAWPALYAAFVAAVVILNTVAYHQWLITWGAFMGACLGWLIRDLVWRDRLRQLRAAAYEAAWDAYQRGHADGRRQP